MPPAADIFGTKIALKDENNGLLMPTAGCMLSAKFLKLGTFKVKAITWDGFSVGGTWNYNVIAIIIQFDNITLNVTFSPK